MSNYEPLSEENIYLTENFIINNECRKIQPSLSLNDMEYAQTIYDKIKKMPITSYIQFGCTAYGMSSYGFYKAKNNEIYIIKAYMNTITTYYNIDDCSFIKKNEK